jgi:hypothetical protein
MVVSESYRGRSPPPTAGVTSAPLAQTSGPTIRGESVLTYRPPTGSTDPSSSGAGSGCAVAPTADSNRSFGLAGLADGIHAEAVFAAAKSNGLASQAGAGLGLDGAPRSAEPTFAQPQPRSVSSVGRAPVRLPGSMPRRRFPKWGPAPSGAPPPPSPAGSVRGRRPWLDLTALCPCPPPGPICRSPQAAVALSPVGRAA